ncbi:hypothetical protein [Isoptericola sp. NPDC056134]|uniref:hypothetical protein n=1 Tax=Isoptericola sp. NPDC056134 TaxID=3345723 RepID=UPI0035E5B32B
MPVVPVGVDLDRVEGLPADAACGTLAVLAGADEVHPVAEPVVHRGGGVVEARPGGGVVDHVVVPGGRSRPPLACGGAQRALLADALGRILRASLGIEPGDPAGGVLLDVLQGAGADLVHLADVDAGACGDLGVGPPVGGEGLQAPT